MNTPYDTGKIKIGSNYKPKPYIETDKDMLLIQKALLLHAKGRVPFLSMIKTCFRGLSFG